MDNQELVQKYLEALHEGKFGQLEELAERAGYDGVLTVEELFGRQWIEKMQHAEELGYIDPTQYWSGLIREKSNGNGRSYVAGGQRNGKSKLMKGKIHGEDGLGNRLMHDVYYDPEFTAPIHWTGFGIPGVTTVLVKLPITYTRRGFQKLFNPDHTKYNATAIKELVAEAYHT